MPIQLAVVRPFQAYVKGDRITDADTINSILASPHACDVVRVRISQEG